MTEKGSTVRMTALPADDWQDTRGRIPAERGTADYEPPTEYASRYGYAFVDGGMIAVHLPVRTEGE